VSWLAFAGVGWTGVSFNGMNKKNEENEPRRSSWFVFWTYWPSRVEKTSYDKCRGSRLLVLGGRASVSME